MVPSLNCISYFVMRRLRIIFIIITAKARPGQAWRPNPKCILSIPILVMDLCVRPSLQRKPANLSALATIELSRLNGPDGKQIWVPAGMRRPSERTRLVLAIRWKFTINLLVWLAKGDGEGDTYLLS